jgi:hypothetical protein
MEIMSSLLQSTACTKPTSFLHFNSRNLGRAKKLEKSHFGIESLRIYVKLEENGTIATAISAAGPASSVVEGKTSSLQKEREGTSSLQKEREVTSSKFCGKFQNPKWKNGTWDFQQFSKDGKVDWDAVIDAEVQRRKCLEDNPEPSSEDEPVIFHTYMIPWWVWAKRFYLPEAELLSGRAAMIGFFMAYLVESLTGVGLVDQMDSVFGKLFLLITVSGVLLIRKNEDISKLKQFVKEWTLYDKQWKATWQDETPENPERD